MTATEATAESSLGDPAPGSAEEGQDQVKFHALPQCLVVQLINQSILTVLLLLLQQRPDLAALEAVERACSDVRILVPCNAKLAPQATVYFVFWLFAADLSGPLAPPWPTAVLTKLFESFWGVEATSRCSKCLDGPGGKQVEYRFARPTGAPQLEPERLKRFLHVDLLGLLLQSTEIGNRKGRSYRLELTPETHQYCFGSKPWDTRDWASEALRCWRLLCQRQPTRRCAETASKLASLPKHEPAEVRAGPPPRGAGLASSLSLSRGGDGADGRTAAVAGVPEAVDEAWGGGVLASVARVGPAARPLERVGPGPQGLQRLDPPGDGRRAVRRPGLPAATAGGGGQRDREPALPAGPLPGGRHLLPALSQ